jgi:Mg2+-importing ATPase
VLLNNLLSDVPAMAISTDRVDDDAIERVPRWDIAEVQRFMIVFGLVSSLFDVLGFALLRLVFNADAVLFHSAWFVMSLLTELAVLLTLRSRDAAWRSAPTRLLAGLTVGVAVLAWILPHLPWTAALFGFTGLPPMLWATLLGLVLAYAAATELTKRWFFRRSTPARRRRVRAAGRPA